MNGQQTLQLMDIHMGTDEGSCPMTKAQFIYRKNPKYRLPKTRNFNKHIYSYCEIFQYAFQNTKQGTDTLTIHSIARLIWFGNTPLNTIACTYVQGVKIKVNYKEQENSGKKDQFTVIIQTQEERSHQKCTEPCDMANR